jgi:bifunctional non-homologous end joining protein LigD
VATPRLPKPQWVEPELVVEVGFHEWTSQGVLRAPRYRGLRDDKAAADVVRET